jgi:putative ABC transport system permease protein
MDALFGLSMNTIMVVLLAIFGVCMAVVTMIFLANRIVFMMGVRNIPRRPSQTVLIVVGLMLSTVIITAAFTTGDTVDYSITKQTYDIAGHADIILDGEVGTEDGNPNPDANDTNIAGEEYRRFLAAADEAGMEHVDGYVGALFEPVPVIDTNTNLSEPNVAMMGIDPDRLDAFPDIVNDDTGEVVSLNDLGQNEVFVNESAADELEAKAGDTVRIFVQGEPIDLTVRAIVRDTFIAGATDFAAKEGMVTSLPIATELFDEDEVTVILISATGGVRDSLDATKLAEVEVNELIAQNNLRMEVSDTKVDFVEEAEEIGNFMTTFFLLLGMFSIGAGMLLIVMIFVMLAAERKSEMGMARAVGMKRRHLVEQFLSEGSGYNLGSALIGVVIGVLVAFALTTAASSLFESFGFTFTPHATWRTAIVSFCLGAVLTFLTVAFSSWRNSNLNIVAAIRDISEVAKKRMGWKGLAFWGVAILLGALFFWLGLDANGAFGFAFGFSLMGMGAAVLLTHFGAHPRATYTAMGFILLLVWGLTAGGRLESIFGPLNGDIEMFFLSAVAMTTASTFILIYNLDVFLALVERTGGLFSGVLPALRTAVAYPMANRFRTGMTLAMISLVVFALTMMSSMNLNYDRLFLRDDSRGGWDLQAVENPNNPLPGLREALAASEQPELAGEIKAEGGVMIAGFDSATEVSQGEGEWDDYFVKGLTDDFIDNGRVPLDMIAVGYEDAADVWQELKTNPDVAVVDRFTVESGFGPSEFSLEGIDISEDTFDPPTISVRDATTGKERDVRVIGVVAFGASGNFTGVFVGADAFIETFGEPELSVHYASLNDAGDDRELARDIEAALVTTGAQVDSLKEIAEEQNALSRGFLYLMQAFMGLGLVVGIAAIGVIAFRTVVERRQQIGMLRAIGYKRGTVSLSFLLESSFVTVLGVMAGNVLGLWLAYFLVTGDDFPVDGNTFYIPWLEITVISGLTVFASLLMTLIPARQAASVPTAEALRYE